MGEIKSKGQRERERERELQGYKRLYCRCMLGWSWKLQGKLTVKCKKREDRKIRMEYI